MKCTHQCAESRVQVDKCLSTKGTLFDALYFCFSKTELRDGKKSKFEIH